MQNGGLKVVTRTGGGGYRQKSLSLGVQFSISDLFAFRQVEKRESPPSPGKKISSSAAPAGVGGGSPPPQKKRRLTPCSNSMLNLLEWGETVVGCITGAGGEKKGGGAEKNPSSLRRRRRPCLPRNATTPPPPFCGWAAECNRGLGGGGGNRHYAVTRNGPLFAAQ